MRKYLKYIDELVILLGLVVALAVIYVLQAAKDANSLGELVEQRANLDLTAAQALKQKKSDLVVPIASNAEYRRCGATVFSPKVSGEPLSCSASRLTDKFLRVPGKPGQTFYRQFGPACNRHDYCYAHGASTYGLGKAQCDRLLLADSLNLCRMIYSDYRPEKVWGLDLRTFCRFRAKLGYAAVSLWGKTSYHRNYSPVCDYGSGPFAVRDQLVSGRFLGLYQPDHFVSIRLLEDSDTVKVTLARLNSQGQSEDVSTTQLVAGDVAVADRDRACQRLLKHSNKNLCPDNFTLGQTLIIARDWLRFPPLVVDHDGDGQDEIILQSTTPDFGMAFTHLKFIETGGRIELETKAYLGIDRTADDNNIGDCEWGLEFHNCWGVKVRNDYSKYKGKGKELRAATWLNDIPRKAELRKENKYILSGYPANQQIIHQIVPLKRKIEESGLWVHDLAMMSSRAFVDQNGKIDKGYQFRRFTFKPENGSNGNWVMFRDSFTRDSHPVAKCKPEDENEERKFDQYRRFHYKAFPFRTKVDDEVSDDRLATFQREKCPTSSINPRPGALGDVDLMVYTLDTDYKETLDYRVKGKRVGQVLKIANTSWSPLIWSEAAHPVITSEAARQNGIFIVSSYIGGVERVEYPIISLLRNSEDTHRKLLRAKLRRWPDTFGLLSERYRVRWRREIWGHPAIYYELPSVLAPVSPDGKKGLSVVYFANLEVSVWDQNRWVYNQPNGKGKIDADRFRVLILPVSSKDTRDTQTGAMIDCPSSSVSQHPTKKFSVKFRSAANNSDDWSRSFLKYEPVLSGHYLDVISNGNVQAGGNLAVSWRDENGDIAITGFYHDGQQWRFGGQECKVIGKPTVHRLY